MFGIVRLQDPSHTRVPKGRSAPPFHGESRGSLRDFPDRAFLELNGIGPSRNGRSVVGGRGCLARCLERGGGMAPDTAGRVRILMAKPPLRARICREPVAFTALMGTESRVIGYRAVRNASFAQRLHRGASRYLDTAKRVCGRAHTQARDGERREWLQGRMVVIRDRGGRVPPAVNRHARSFKSRQRPEDLGGESMIDYPTLLNTEEAARCLGLSPRTLQRYRVTGEGPEFLKIGRTVRYTASKLNRWLEGCARASTSDEGHAEKRVNGKGKRQRSGN